MTTALIVAAIFAPAVFTGNYIYDKKCKNPHNWKRGLLMAGISAALIIVIGLITE